MKIVIFTAGTQGDARPHVALGQGLERRGHRVTLVTSRDFATLIRGAGLDFAPLTADFAAMMQADRDRIDGRSQFQIVRHGLRRLREMASRWAAEGVPPCQDADLIIGSGTALYLAASIAEALRISFIRTMLQPIEPAREITPMIFGAHDWPGPVNLALHGLARHATWQLGRGAMTRVRRDLGLAPYPLTGPFRSALAGAAPLLNGFSPTLVPPSRDWGPHVTTTGFWHLDTPAGFAPDPRVEAFLATGPKPIYVGFGSMVTRDGAALALIIRDALREVGTRAIIAGGWTGLTLEPGDDVLLTDAIPHDWLFARVALAVHHCGAGTTAAAARAGIPSVPIPFLLDQFFWADRLFRLGVASRPLVRARMTRRSLADAIGFAYDPIIARQAGALAARLRAEDGVGTAIGVIERTVASN